VDLWQALRWAHIAAGVLSFVVAPVALATAKGGPAHRRWGAVYVAGMTFATLSATVLAATTDNTFFTFVGLFSFYLGFSGYRAVGKRARVRWFDWAVAAVIGAAMLGMLAYGGTRVASGALFYLPLVVFGAVGAFVVGRDLSHLARPPADRNAWLYGHMIGMVSSATAAMSAFSVTNATFLPPVPRILWPACVGIPVLVLWVRAYKRRLAGRAAGEVVTVRDRGGAA
jgi:uncharacterized membrane protein